MGRIYMPCPNRTSPTQSEKAQTHDNQPMKRSKDILEFIKASSREYCDFVSKTKGGGDFFSKSKHGKVRGQLLKVMKSCLGNKTLLETWTVIEESGLGQLLIKAYKRESKHPKKRLTFKHSKPMHEHFSISLILLQF